MLFYSLRLINNNKKILPTVAVISTLEKQHADIFESGIWYPTKWQAVSGPPEADRPPR